MASPTPRGGGPWAARALRPKRKTPPRARSLEGLKFGDDQEGMSTMAKNTRKQDLAQVKKSLAILRKKGLYKPKSARKAPTKYAKSLLKKYSDVVANRSFVVKATKEAAPKLAEHYRVTRGRVVIPKAGMNVKPKITAKGEVIRRIAIDDKSYRYRPAHMVDGDWPELGPHQSYTVQVRYGRRGGIVSVGTREELINLINEYSHKNERGFDLTPFVMIAEQEGTKKFRVYFVKEGSREKSRTVKVAYADQAIDEFRYRFPEFSDWIVTKVVPVA